MAGARLSAGGTALAAVLASCAGGGAASGTATMGGTAPALRGGASLGPSDSALSRIDGSRWTWVEAECNDGALDLARLGFEREFTLDVQEREGSLLLTFDTELVTAGCSATSVWSARPAGDAERWLLQPQAVVSVPVEGECGARERDATLGTLRMSADVFEIVTQRSSWCRGFDARFVYRRAPARRLLPRDVVTRYVAHFNRGDANALADLFVDSGALVEPFTRTGDGNYKRHEGRGRVRAWYANAFASAPWHALRLLSVAPGGDDGHVIAQWEYMDPHLSEPLVGRNLFVVAGGEIYETEIQLVSDPKVKTETGGASLAAPTDAAPPTGR
jgi:hypothetical protein